MTVCARLCVARVDGAITGWPMRRRQSYVPLRTETPSACGIVSLVGIDRGNWLMFEVMSVCLVVVGETMHVAESSPRLGACTAVGPLSLGPHGVLLVMHGDTDFFFRSAEQRHRLC